MISWGKITLECIENQGRIRSRAIRNPLEIGCNDGVVPIILKI